MRRLYIICLVGFLALGHACAQSRFANGIVAVVNDEVITWNEVTNVLGPTVEMLAKQWADQPRVFDQKVLDLQKERIEELVSRQLILNEFTNTGYNLPETIIEDQVRERIRKDFGDRVTMTKTLNAEGITHEMLRKKIRESIIINFLQEQRVSRELIISPYQIEKSYQENLDKYKVEDEVKLRVIVVNKSREAPETAREIAREIHRKIKAGASFAEMASVYSEGSQRVEGGDWGWVERSVPRKELADVAFALGPGQLSEIIDTPTACYVMLVEDKRTSHVKPLAEVRDEIERKLIAQERERLFKQWIDRLKAKSFVRYY